MGNPGSQSAGAPRAWALQPALVEVWSEKGTVRGTLAPVLNAYGVGFRVMHGFAPATIVHEIAEAHGASDRPLLPLYVGDWDPSGLYMSEGARLFDETPDTGGPAS
jgi:hypothetical protein